MALLHLASLVLLCFQWGGVSVSARATATGPIPAAQRVLAATPRQLTGRFLHLSDFHPDDFYRVHTSTAAGEACHRGKGPAGTYGAETTDCDSPVSLVDATFEWIRAHLRDQVDFVVWTGDSARHDSDEQRPRTEEQVLGTNRLLVRKFLDVFGDGDGRLAIPVIPTLGNNDVLPHNILLPGPNRWLATYTQIWAAFIPEEQRHGFSFGGWFSVEVIPGRLAVFSLNTLFLFDRNAAVDGCSKPSEPGYQQMEWLRVQLQALRQRGVKAIITGHVPPARTDSKRLWDETCWQKYTLWLHQFRDLVVVGLYGHMNIDHFMLHDTKELDYVDAAEDEDVDEDEGEDTVDVDVGEALHDRLTVQSATEYLNELRESWSRLKLPQPGSTDSASSGRKRKPKHAGRWAERYQLSLVSPSIVPNYFPTLRVLEYNITGLQDTSVWTSSSESMTASVPDQAAHLDLRHLADTDGKKKHKHRKGKKPHKDRNLIVPEPPSKSAPPGPAYSPQPLSLLAYTQYFANLTHINNLMLQETDGAVAAARTRSPPDWLTRWRGGKHAGKTPVDASPSPREFAFEVEYSTSDDRLYRLGDMTVGSFVELASRMARQAKGRSEIGDEFEGEEDGDTSTRHKNRYNKTWIRFLEHAFVKTVGRKELKKMA